MSGSENPRRLSTILAADVVGYSSLMEADEEGTVRQLNSCREITDECIHTHNGRIFGGAGDSLVAEFTSPVEAVRCATRIQNELNEINSDPSTTRPMQLRIGVNLGDVIVQDDNLLGDGVNIASRLESISDPGGITISGSVYEHIKKKLRISSCANANRLVATVRERAHEGS